MNRQRFHKITDEYINACYRGEWDLGTKASHLYTGGDKRRMLKKQWDATGYYSFKEVRNDEVDISFDLQGMIIDRDRKIDEKKLFDEQYKEFKEFLTDNDYKLLLEEIKDNNLISFWADK